VLPTIRVLDVLSDSYRSVPPSNHRFLGEKKQKQSRIECIAIHITCKKLEPLDLSKMILFLHLPAEQHKEETHIQLIYTADFI
jgi:hypothetical protein